MKMTPAMQAARDAGVLESGRVMDRRGGCLVVRVQCTARSEQTLKRAGVKRPARFEVYDIPAARDRLGRLQLAEGVTV